MWNSCKRCRSLEYSWTASCSYSSDEPSGGPHWESWRKNWQGSIIFGWWNWKSEVEASWGKMSPQRHYFTKRDGQLPRKYDRRWPQGDLVPNRDVWTPREIWNDHWTLKASGKWNRNIDTHSEVVRCWSASQGNDLGKWVLDRFDRSINAFIEEQSKRLDVGHFPYTKEIQPQIRG